MTANMFGVIDLVLPFAVVLALLLRELWILRRLRQPDEQAADIKAGVAAGKSDAGQ